MPRHRIELRHEFDAPPERVFDYFAAHETFANLWPAKITRLRDGDEERDGVGSVREIRVGPLAFEETIVTYQRPALLEYRITRGGPLRNHHGRIAFHPQGAGTRLEYSIEFDGRVPLIGGLIAKSLVRDFERGVIPVAAELAAAAA